MSLAKFGPFASVFAQGELRVPGYLELLALRDASTQIVFDRIQQVLRAGAARAWVDAMFDDPDWRPHLVGAIALLMDDGATFNTESLWRAIDRGSWVIPQLVVTASFVDERCEARFRTRIEGGCPVSVPTDLTPLERHSATGPGTVGQRSAKLLVSLLTVGASVPRVSEWIVAKRSEPGVLALAARDVDHADGIVERWRAALVQQFAARGRELRPR